MAKVPRTTVAKVITAKLASMPADKLSEEVAAYLLDENRVGELDSLLRDVMQQRADAGIVEVTARSAHSLNTNVRGDIEAQVQALYSHAKQVFIQEEIDPALIGGVKIELANEQLDLSIRAKLNRLKQLTAVGE